jgi:molybdate transport system ATP-binding protein
MQILVENITIRIDGRTLFEHTTWQMGKGQNWAVIGPTGSGKSSLVRAVCGAARLADGRITYQFDDGEERTYIYPHEVRVLSPEDHQQFLNRHADYHQARWQASEGGDSPTVADLISIESLMQHSPFEVSPPVVDEMVYLRQRVFVMDLFDLQKLLGRKALHLSHGESRKVLLARILLQAPRLLVLDSPFSGLDHESRAFFREAVEILLQRAEPRILMVSGRLGDVCDGVTHLLVVDRQRVAAQGSRAQITRCAELQPLLHDLNSEDILADDRMVRLYAEALEITSSQDADALTSKPMLISMKNVSVAYSAKGILKNVNWTVLKGERWALLGPNGAGKSTLLSLILADNPQTYANQVALFGKARTTGEAIWEVKQAIGWVSPELHAFYPQDVTCFDVVCSGFFSSVGLFRSSSPAQRSAAAGWMETLAIDGLSVRPFKAASAGQQRLVLLARALVKNPSLLVLDEPCQALDDHHSRQFVGLIDRLCRQAPLTLIYVTHDREEIPQSVTHLLQLEAGEVVHCGKFTGSG